jgi:hypothetical protein
MSLRCWDAGTLVGLLTMLATNRTGNQTALFLLNEYHYVIFFSMPCCSYRARDPTEHILFYLQFDESLGLKRTGSFDSHRMFLLGNSVAPKMFEQPTSSKKLFKSFINDRNRDFSEKLSSNNFSKWLSNIAIFYFRFFASQK